jgi:hypothetical protein
MSRYSFVSLMKIPIPQHWSDQLLIVKCGNTYCSNDPVCWSGFLATDPEVRVRFPELPHFLRSSGSGTGSTQPREYNWEATWKKSNGSALENREYGPRDPSRWPSGTLYLDKLSLTSPTSGGRSVGIVLSRTQTTEIFIRKHSVEVGIPKTAVLWDVLLRSQV